ncbi:MAG: LacI family DNA-binding transcriptional regulator [Actinobacteria bacterium]|nr:LacI family DNA-binding transcriptional regulator [Actinomycetota bacterium]
MYPRPLLLHTLNEQNTGTRSRSQVSICRAGRESSRRTPESGRIQAEGTTVGRDRASIKDVARVAGVSVGTVSNVLNRPEFVSEPTRQRVRDAMNQLGFVRNATARQLRAGHSQTVGVVVLDLANPFYTGIVRGIEDRLAEDNHLLMLCSSDENEDRETRYLRQFAEQGVRGILITPFGNLNERFDILTNLQIPVVLLDTHSPDMACVSVDNVKGGRLAVAHLLDQGHRRIALFNGPLEIQQCRDRSAGTMAAVYEAGLDPAQVVVEVALRDLTSEAGAEAMAALLDSDEERPTAVFCVNDIVALGVMRALREHDIAVPEEMAVVGYDDVPVIKELRTPLTSVRQPMHDIGWNAADLLLTGKVKQVRFSPELVVRGSSDYHR